MTLRAKANDNEHIPCVIVWNGKADISDGGGIAFSVVGDHENRPTDMTNILVVNDGYNRIRNQSK